MTPDPAGFAAGLLPDQVPLLHELLIWAAATRARAGDRRAADHCLRLIRTYRERRAVPLSADSSAATTSES